MAILDDVKLRLRVTSTAFDTSEITPLINAAQKDLIGAGVREAIATDPDNNPLVKEAIVLYCKANFGMDNAMMEKYQKSYDHAKTHLAIDLDYGEQGA